MFKNRPEIIRLIINREFLQKTEETVPKLLTKKLYDGSTGLKKGLVLMWEYISYHDEQVVINSLIEQTFTFDLNSADNELISNIIYTSYTDYWEVFNEEMIIKGIVIAQPRFVFSKESLDKLLEDILG